MGRRADVRWLRLAAPVAVIVSVLLVAPGGGGAAGSAPPTVVAATADTFVRADRPVARFGAARRLVVGRRPQATAFLRFDVTVPQGVPVARATLQLTAVSGAGTVAPHRVLGPWSERGTRFESAPPVAPRRLAPGAAVRAGDTISLDVTRLVRGSGTVDVALRAAKGSLVFRSREAAGGGPTLVVETAEDAGNVAAGPCGRVTRPPGRVDHVIWIFMENTAYDRVIGSPSAPFINELASSCGLATDYRGITHPSLPNYIAATSGSTHGITDDDNPAAHPLTGPSIYSQVKESGRTWRDYAESSPGPCPTFAAGRYTPRHDPATYYTDIREDCLRWAIPMGTTAGGAFASDLESGALPAFSFVTPDLCNDMHDCPVATGDEWLRGWFAKILASPAYRSGRTVVFLTWDEDDFTPANHVALVAVAPSVPPGTRLATPANHYALLKTTEQLLGITTFLGHAGDPGTPSLAPGFNLG